MSDLPKKRGKRGRPPKIPEKKAKQDVDTRDPSNAINLGNPKDKPADKPKHQNELLEVYNHLRSIFVSSGVSQQSQLLIRRIASNLSTTGEFSSQPLLRILNDILQELILNELEVVSWAIVLDRFNWKENTIPIQNLLLNIAFAIKSQLNEDTSPFKAYLATKSMSFMDEFNIWVDPIKPLLNINAKDINNKFKELSKLVGVPGDSKIHDYNYYVDEILQISPPYSQETKEENSQSAKKREDNIKEESVQRKPSDFTEFESSSNAEQTGLPKVDGMTSNFLSAWERPEIKKEDKGPLLPSMSSLR